MKNRDRGTNLGKIIFSFCFLFLKNVFIFRWSLIFVVFIPLFIASAVSTFVDDTQTEFDLGSYSDTVYDTVNSWIDLSATGLTNKSGTYTSNIKDAGTDAIWQSISYIPQRPTGKELPNNSVSETGYAEGNANMTDNVLLLHLNEASLDGATGGNDAEDSSGNSNHASESGGVTVNVPGKFNKAYDFDGVDDYLVCGVNNFTTTLPITLSTWAYFDTDQASGDYDYVLMASDFSNGDIFNIAREAGTNKLYYTADSGVKSGAVLPTGEWVHIAMVFNSTVPYVRSYINGVEQTISQPSTPLSPNNPKCVIGYFDYSGGLHFFDGKVDEVAIWNRALSDNEILDLYKRGALRLRTQVRSCDDSLCSGEVFIGPDGTSSTYYEWGDTNSANTPSFSLSNVLNNRYFQYKVFFETDNSSYSPELKSFTTSYTLVNYPPDKPTNTSPADGNLDQDLNLSLVASNYTDTESDAHTDTEWQIDDNSDFSSPVWTRTAGAGETTVVVNSTNGSFANELNGKSELDHNTVYYWRVRYSDGVWSEWSTATSFTTNNISKPANQSPADNATVTTLTPLLVATSFSDGQSGHTHVSSQWLVDDNSDFSSPEYDSGETTSAEVSHAVPTGNLSNFSTYYWKVRYKDSSGKWSEYSTSTVFSIQVSSTSIEVRPIFGNMTVDQGDSINIDVQVLNFTDGTPITDANTTITVYDPSGTKIVDSQNMSYVSGSNGVYRYTYTVPNENGSYLYEVKSTKGTNNGYGAANFEVKTISSDIASTKTTVSNNLDVKVSSRSSETTVDEIKQQVKSGLLPLPLTVKSGDTITIRYRAESGLSGSGIPKVNVYDSNDVQRVVDADMSEMGSTGVYKYDLSLQTSWGTGFFTVIVSESTNNTFDYTQMFVGAYDIEKIGSDLEDHENSQLSSRSDITSIKTTVENTATNVDSLVGSLIVTQSSVNDTSASDSTFITSLTNTNDDFYKNAVLTFTSGNLNGQSRRISSYNGTTKQITVNPSFISAPSNGDTFTIVKQNLYIEEQIANHESSQSAFRTDVVSRLTDIEGKVDSIISDINSIDTDLGSVLSVVNNIRTSQQKNYTVTLSDVSEVQSGGKYRAKLTVLDYEENPVDANSDPVILIYDPTRTVALSSTSMTKISTGVYEYEYSIGSTATSGLWETVVSVDLGLTDSLTLNDYWQLSGSPAQVYINSIVDNTVPTISANVTITNEGVSDYEYQYEWCVVLEQENDCGGDDDVYYASAAKLIKSGDSFNPVLDANVPDTGKYWFKLIVYFGTEASGASRTFNAVDEDRSVAGGTIIYNSNNREVNNISIATNENIYTEIIRAKKQIEINAIKLERILESLGILKPVIFDNIDINDKNLSSIKDIQNSIADLKALLGLARRVTEESGTEPIIETYMKFGSIEMVFLIHNPSNKTKTINFKSSLPKEVRPEHILDLDGLNVGYESDSNSYYVYDDILLKPGETVEKIVKIEDIWVFDEMNLNILRKQAKRYLEYLDGSNFYNRGFVLNNNINYIINTILDKQDISYKTPEEHIIAYRENARRVDIVKNNLEQMKELAVQLDMTRTMVGNIGNIQTFTVWSVILVILLGFGMISLVVFIIWRHHMSVLEKILGEEDVKKNKKRKDDGIFLNKIVSKKSVKIAIFFLLFVSIIFIVFTYNSSIDDKQHSQLLIDADMNIRYINSEPKL